jgi:cysteine desulfurase/selenocysteine lyase
MSTSDGNDAAPSSDLELAGFDPGALLGSGPASPLDTQALGALANELFRRGMQAIDARGFAHEQNFENLGDSPGVAVAPRAGAANSATTGMAGTGTERLFSPPGYDAAARGNQPGGSPPHAPVWSSSETRRFDVPSPATTDPGNSSLYFLEHARDAMQRLNGTETRVPSFESAVPGTTTLAPAIAAGSAGQRAAPASYLHDTRALPSLSGVVGRQFDAASLRRDFPILSERVNGKPLIWLDNAATTHKPQSVIDRLAYFYAHENSNIHRGAHTLAARSTDAYEAAREKVRRFLSAPSVHDIVFTRGTTESINLVAQSWGRRNLRAGDEIVITWLEHHSNIVPWQLLCSQTGAKLKVAPVDDSGQILLDEYEKLFGARTRFASLTQVSNALGTITPVKDMVDIAHRYGARVLVDGAQAVSHLRVDVQALDCDFYVFSGHKLFGPTGIGALYGKSEVLDAMPPWQGGGNMIADVTFEKTVYHAAPMRFEAGTGNIADAVGLGAAIDYLEQVGMENVTRYEHELLQYGAAKLLEVPKLRPIGTAKEKASVMSFVMDGLSTEQVGAALAKEGIAVRAGHHCAQPALRRFGLESTVRPSLALYNTREDIDALVAVLKQLQSSWLI